MESTINRVTETEEGALLEAPGYSLKLTFDCGQCFRFEPTVRGTFEGIAFGEYIEMSQPEEGKILLHGVSASESEKWMRFLSIDKDWEAVKSDVSSRSPVLYEASELAGGIRILKQDEFEALISFVISQCNNIPRIKGLISALSKNYGKAIETPDGRTLYAFPDASTLASLPISELRALKLGYRAEYVQNAANATLHGLIEEVKAEEDTRAAIKLLTSVGGIGEKVAACTLLFGFGRLDAFPKDVWIKRAMEKYFPGCKDTSVFGPYAGVAQQYLFYRERYLGE
ncbi:MAG: DNA-3-methyladenine glycosylase 2 family protein [Clostridia bacterium]|nr:DNA-3-methyladenine glycosylase 2 family protein [Clostridia bacterium]